MPTMTGIIRDTNPLPLIPAFTMTHLMKKGKPRKITARPREPIPIVAIEAAAFVFTSFSFSVRVVSKLYYKVSLGVA